MIKKSKYSASQIANYFLWMASKENIDITPMKLIKLVYIAYGWNLVINKENPKLFSDPIEAWLWGPVIPTIYHEFKQFANKPIPKGNYSELLNPENGEVISVPIINMKDEMTLNSLNAVWKYCKNHNATELSNITHEPAGAWDKAWTKGRNSILSDVDIEERSLEAMNRFINN